MATKKRSVSRLKRYRKVIFLLVCIFIFVIALNRSYDRFVVRASQATKKIYNVNAVIEEREEDISTGEIFRQEIIADRNGLNSILVKINKKQILHQDDYIIFQLYDNETGESIKQWVVRGFRIRQGKYITLKLDKEFVGVNGKSYDLYLQKIFGDADKNEDLKKSAEEVKDLYQVKNLDGRINYALVGNSSAFIMSYFKPFAVLLFVLSVFCIAFVLFKRRICVEKVAVIYVLVFGLLYMIVFPPFCTPDEYAHFVASYNLSDKMMGIEKTEEETIPMDVYACDGYFTRYASLRHYQYIIDAFRYDSGEAETKLAQTYSYAGDAGHYVQALGITAARIMNLGYIYMIYAGRLFNLLFFSVCICFAIKLIPIGKECLFMVSMLPMAMEIITSQSYDVFILGLSFLLIAYILNLVYQRERIDIKNVLVVGMLLVLLFPCKYIYVLLSLLVVLIPSRKIKKKKQILITVGIVLCIIGISLGKRMFVSNEDTVIEETDEKEFQTNLKDTISDGENLYSISDILEKPVESINIFLNTLRDRSGHYIETMFGRYLGSLTVEISSILIIGFYVLILLSGLKNTKETINISVWHRVVFGFIFLAIAGSALLAMFVSWTPKPGDVIQGVQGRYFLPAFPLAILTLKMDVIELKKDYTKFLCVSTGILQFFVLLYSVEQIISVW